MALCMRWFPLCKEARIAAVFKVEPDMVELKTMDSRGDEQSGTTGKDYRFYWTKRRV